MSTRRMAMAATMGVLFSGCGGFAAYKLWHQSSYIKWANSNNRQPNDFPLAFSIPTDLRERFNYYATRDADGREVLDIAGFIACLCFLDREKRELFLSDAYEHLPLHVRQRIECIHKLMDVDNDNKIVYEEFCIFLSLLFARREHLKVAFCVFDQNESKTLSYNEFGHLLNALMIDPSVKIVNMQSPSTLQNKTISVDPNELLKSTAKFTMREFLASPLAMRLFGSQGGKELSFDELYTLLHNIRQEVWALEFGLCDPQNTGYISLDDCRKIVFCNLDCSSLLDKNNVHDGSDSYYFRKKNMERVKIDTSDNSNGGRVKNKHDGEILEGFTSWDTFLKVLDVIFEYDVVNHVMTLALRAKSEEEIEQNMNQHQRKQLELDQGTFDLSLVNTNECELDSEEFYHVLRSCQGHFPHITKDDMEKIVRIFDIDGSGKLSPGEFAQMCQRRTSYLLPRQARYDNLQRTAIQHFLFCMQQL